MGTLENLRKEAKRWLKALRTGDAEARERLARAWPSAPAAPVLRDVHHALARERGHESWIALKTGIAAAVAAKKPAPDADPARLFLEFACWDHHTHGAGDHRMHDRAAGRHLAQHPEIARHDLYCAIVCGNVGEVRRILDARPEAAREPGGARDWSPLLYLCFTRLTHRQTIDHALEIGALLLDRGADPNDFYMAGDSEYSALVGAAGEGEQDSPRQPYAEALYRLLLERGAGPYDIQVLYNTHFSGDMLWWLEATYQHAVATGRKSDWDDPAWPMLDMGGYGPGAYFVLKSAIDNDNDSLAAWALEHGAGPDITTSSHPKFNPKHTLLDHAIRIGSARVAERLRRHGARSAGIALEPDQEFAVAALRLDRAALVSLIDRHPELRRSHQAMFEAAKRDRPDTIALLLDVGVPLEVADRSGARALHHAAANNALRAAAFLIERGADVDPKETQWDGTPIGWAAHGDHIPMIDLLSRHTRNVWTLAFRGYVDRLRQILQEDPALAQQATRDGITPLWWLPDDEDKAMEIVELLLAAGADPARRNVTGGTAAAWAQKRGMTAVARRLGIDRQTVGVESRPTEPIPAPEPGPADVPIEMRTPFPVTLPGGAIVPTTAVWAMLTAARDGDLESVKELTERCERLVVCAYNYMPPLHLAVREGHLAVVRYLAERGAVNPKYATYPYNEPLLTVASDRGFLDIRRVLEEYAAKADPSRPEEEGGHIDYRKDPERHRFEKLVDQNALGPVEDLLQKRPELATDQFAFWSEGILMMPAHDQRPAMLELLLRYGARVPDVTKWGREYYFKWHDIGALLLERGMNPNHMNCHHTTLLHDMAQLGDARRATLLLDRGAAIDAIDREFQSTPLGLAARWGHRSLVRLLLDRGADRRAAGAEWATPLAWARKKGHDRIAADLE